MIEFIGSIRELKIKTDSDACLTGRISIEFPPTDEVIVELKKLYQPDTNVKVVIMGEDGE